MPKQPSNGAKFTSIDKLKIGWKTLNKTKKMYNIWKMLLIACQKPLEHLPNDNTASNLVGDWAK